MCVCVCYIHSQIVLPPFLRLLLAFLANPRLARSTRRRRSATCCACRRTQR